MTSEHATPEDDRDIVIRQLRAEVAAERATAERLRKQCVWACDQIQLLSTEARIQEARVTLSLRYLQQIREREKSLLGQVAEIRRQNKLAEERRRRLEAEDELQALRTRLEREAAEKPPVRALTIDGGKLQARAIGLLQQASQQEADSWSVLEQGRMESTLDEIRRAEGASTAVLSDAFGLPVAVVGDTSFTDALAALAGVAQAFASNAVDLLPFRGVRSLVVEDESVGTVSYTLFEQEGERFLLALFRLGVENAQQDPGELSTSALRPSIRIATESPRTLRLVSTPPSTMDTEAAAADGDEQAQVALPSDTYRIARATEDDWMPSREVRRGNQ